MLEFRSLICIIVPTVVLLLIYLLVTETRLMDSSTTETTARFNKGDIACTILNNEKVQIIRIAHTKEAYIVRRNAFEDTLLMFDFELKECAFI